MDAFKKELKKKIYFALPAKLRDTVALRAFGFFKVPLIFHVGPTVVELNDQRCVIQVPLNRRTKNHFNSMYFGALAIGADCSGGMMAMYHIEKSGKDLSVIFKDFKAEYFKRPEGDVHFSCEEGPAIQAFVERAVVSGERENLTIKVVATVPSKLGNQPVASFDLTLSIKRR